MHYKSGKAILEALRSNAFRKPVVLTGMIKHSENAHDMVSFAFAGRCDSWIAIPVDLILGADIIDDIACGDHRHPTVLLTLAQPEGKDAHAIALMALLSATLKQMERLKQHPSASLRSISMDTANQNQVNACNNARTQHEIALNRLMASRAGFGSQEWQDYINTAGALATECGLLR